MHLACYRTSSSCCCCCCCCCCLCMRVCQGQYKRGGICCRRRLHSFPPLRYHCWHWQCPFQWQGHLHDWWACWGLWSLVAALLPLQLLIGLVAARRWLCLHRCWESSWWQRVGTGRRHRAKRQSRQCSIMREGGDCSGVDWAGQWLHRQSRRWCRWRGRGEL